MESYTTRKPSKKLTTIIENYVTNENRRKDLAKEAKELDEKKQELTGNILSYIEQGYAPIPGSNYGVAVIEQSGRVSYERLYKALSLTLEKKFPQYAKKIREISGNLERQAIEELETKTAVVCAENSKLEELVKRAEKSELEDRKTKKNIKLVLYT